MNDELPKPYTDYLFIEPFEDIGAVSRTLNCYARVLAKGPDVKDTEVGEYVTFEKWDKPEVIIKDKVYHFLKESEAISKVPASWI